jgi:hypothetical protein
MRSFSNKAPAVPISSAPHQAPPPNIMGFAMTPRTFRHFLWGIQGIFWMLWALLAYNSEPALNSVHGPAVFVACHVPLLMAMVYINYLWLIPRWLAPGQYRRYFLAVFVLIALSQGLRWVLEVYVMREVVLPPERWPMTLALACILLLGSTLFKFVEGWFQVSQQQTALQNEQLRSELRFLRAQVNPHFLFNTLNNLYTLTLTQDARAPQMVAQLSELMRYLIYDSRTTRVSLLRELELMRSYVTLQQLQHEEEMNVDLYFEGVKTHHQIAPLLLISFVENSFKHGDLATNPKGWIQVSAIIEDEHRLQLVFANSKRPEAVPPPAPHGIGLDNARRQLELNYPGRHRMKITHTPQEFRVELEITLTEADHVPTPLSSLPLTPDPTSA